MPPQNKQYREPSDLDSSRFFGYHLTTQLVKR